VGKRGPKPGTGGRPRKDLDEKLFIKYCKYGATQTEISDYFDCDVNTINAWCKRTYKQTFSEVYKKHTAFLNLSLRGAQIRMAIGVEERTEYLKDGTKIVYKGQAPNAMMQVWLGKQRLGQSDQPADETRTEQYTPPMSMVVDDKKAS